jgi:aryl-alcohol dehydrogenase-like predicted oxidoreductase
MAVIAYDAIAGGKLRSKKQLANGDRQAIGKEMSETELRMSEALSKVAEEHGIDSPTAIALAWYVYPERRLSCLASADDIACRRLLQKQPYVFPIIGTRNVNHMLDNVQALKIHLTAEQIEYIESIASFNPGFPETVFGEDPHLNGKAAIMTRSAAHTEWVQSPKAIGRA